MMKRIFAIVVICILLLTGITSTATSITSIQQTRNINNQKFVIRYLDNEEYIFTTVIEDSERVEINTTKGRPDLNLTIFRAWYCKEKCKMHVEYMITNVGDTYYDPEGDPIKYYLELYVDESATPLCTLAIPGFYIGDPSALNSGEADDGTRAYAIDEKPEILRAIVDTTNTIPESDEDNEYITNVHPGVFIYGVVNKKELFGQKPYENVYVMQRGKTWQISPFNITDEEGNYKLSLYPKSTDEEDTYDIGVYGNIRDLVLDSPMEVLTSESVKAGESAELNFLVDSKSKSDTSSLNTILNSFFNHFTCLFSFIKQFLIS